MHVSLKEVCGALRHAAWQSLRQLEALTLKVHDGPCAQIVYIL